MYTFLGIAGYNSIEWAVVDLACALSGCVSVGLHVTYDDSALQYVLNKTGVKLLFCASDLVYR